MHVPFVGHSKAFFAHATVQLLFWVSWTFSTALSTCNATQPARSVLSAPQCSPSTAGAACRAKHKSHVHTLYTNARWLWVVLQYRPLRLIDWTGYSNLKAVVRSTLIEFKRRIGYMPVICRWYGFSLWWCAIRVAMSILKWIEVRSAK